MNKRKSEAVDRIIVALGLWVDPTDPNQRIVKLLKARHGIAGATHTLFFSGDSPRLVVADRGEGEDE